MCTMLNLNIPGKTADPIVAPYYNSGRAIKVFDITDKLFGDAFTKTPSLTLIWPKNVLFFRWS